MPIFIWLDENWQRNDLSKLTTLWLLLHPNVTNFPQLVGSPDSSRQNIEFFGEKRIICSGPELTLIHGGDYTDGGGYIVKGSQGEEGGGEVGERAHFWYALPLERTHFHQLLPLLFGQNIFNKVSFPNALMLCCEVHKVDQRKSCTATRKFRQTSTTETGLKYCAFKGRAIIHRPSKILIFLQEDDLESSMYKSIHSSLLV